jgi:hypothetical protein
MMKRVEQSKAAEAETEDEAGQPRREMSAGRECGSWIILLLLLLKMHTKM